LLYIRGNATHEAAVKKHEIKPIDLLVVNLYPFEQTIAKPNVTLEEAIENIDIGGPAMLRSASKNHDSVTVITDPTDYATVAEQISKTGNTTLELRRQLAAKVFATTSKYDAAIASYLSNAFATTGKVDIAPSAMAVSPSGNWPTSMELKLPLAQLLRYGENPHQSAALYGKFDEYFKQLHGKELSYNNILDLT